VTPEGLLIVGSRVPAALRPGAPASRPGTAVEKNSSVVQGAVAAAHMKQASSLAHATTVTL
jgi:hypothetical protein